MQKENQAFSEPMQYIKPIEKPHFFADCFNLWIEFINFKTLSSNILLEPIQSMRKPIQSMKWIEKLQNFKGQMVSLIHSWKENQAFQLLWIDYLNQSIKKFEIFENFEACLKFLKSSGSDFNLSSWNHSEFLNFKACRKKIKLSANRCSI